MPNTKRVLITDRLRSEADFYRALGNLRQAGERPAPRNLDALADFLRELGLDSIVCADWCLPEADSRRLRRVLDDLDVRLLR
ncbi:hypothetical protein [Corynebacterium confusum]|uniref:hypothetical protein n=1 Tax=Corynebacterium confusum TaxID=71254 RepID=UPI0025B4F008|nr:hypothetical protein [Corynebacterium confusum]WJY90227.1 hypothetical protein CCONF_08565 [Corynebacterium confusum]